MGDNYLTPAIEKWHNNPENCFVRTFQGFKYLYQYYKDRMFTEEKK